MPNHILPPSRAPRYIDLTASLPGLRSSLTPQAAEFSKVTSRLRLREAEHHAAKMLGLGLGSIAGMLAVVIFYLVKYA